MIKSFHYYLNALTDLTRRCYTVEKPYLKLLFLPIYDLVSYFGVDVIVTLIVVKLIIDQKTSK